MGWGYNILVFDDMGRDCVIFSKLLVHRFAEMYNAAEGSKPYNVFQESYFLKDTMTALSEPTNLFSCVKS